jgi:hypothetical protein
MRSDRLEANVTFDAAKGYVATVPDLAECANARRAGNTTSRSQYSQHRPVLMGQALQLHPMQRSWQIEQVNGRNLVMPSWPAIARAPP